MCLKKKAFEKTFLIVLFSFKTIKLLVEMEKHCKDECHEHDAVIRL